jgi:hypothetical protein
VIILSGYLATFDETPDIVIRRKSPPPFKRDYFLSFAQLAIASALCITIPINVISLRTEINSLFFDGRPISLRV